MVIPTLMINLITVLTLTPHTRTLILRPFPLKHTIRTRMILTVTIRKRIIHLIRILTVPKPVIHIPLRVFILKTNLILTHRRRLSATYMLILWPLLSPSTPSIRIRIPQMLTQRKLILIPTDMRIVTLTQCPRLSPIIHMA